MIRRVEVAIVGGGITGAAVSWHFANAGVRVALVDAGLFGRGSTAASTALLMQETDQDYRQLSQRYGPERAALLAAARKGAQLFARSPVRRIVTRAPRVEVITPAGTLVADAGIQSPDHELMAFSRTRHEA